MHVPAWPGNPTDPNVIVEWAEKVLADSRYLDVTAKLLPTTPTSAASSS
jgi:hypothetical protein